MNLFAGQQQRCRHREQTYGCGGGKEGEGARNRDRSVKAYARPNRQIASGHLQYDLGSSNWASCNNLEGWEEGGRFRREETCIYPWLVHIDVQQKQK